MVGSRGDAMTKREQVTEAMNKWKQLLHWLNNEIPQYLDKFDSFDEFNKKLPGCCASLEWKAIAEAMAKERWRK